jgi:hypothetical protein
MADTFVTEKHQSVDEIRQWDIDFGPDLLDGVTVVSATAEHTPPTDGTEVPPTVGDIAEDIVPVRLGPLVEVGVHILQVLAVFSNGEKSEARLFIAVDY